MHGSFFIGRFLFSCTFVRLTGMHAVLSAIECMGDFMTQVNARIDKGIYDRLSEYSEITECPYRGALLKRANAGFR